LSLIADIEDRSVAWSTAVPDWQARLLAGESLLPDLPLFDAVAEKALRIFKRLRVPDLIGTPTYGEVCEEWVFDFVRAVFGSYNPETKTRMIREFFLLIPKKNGKSAIAAAIIVTAAIMNERPAAELILIAPTQKIAGIAFKQAKGIIALDPQLGGPDGLGKEGGIFSVHTHTKEIRHQITGAEIMILSADGDVVTGSKGSFILIDETHVLGHKPKAAEIFLELRGGLASRPEGFLLQITTQSKGRPHGQFARELEQARSVRDGKLDLPILPVLYELPQDMAEAEAWRDEKTWNLVNPNLGLSVSRDYLHDAYTAAKEEGPEALALFASQHLNVQIGLGLQSGRWIGGDYWETAARPDLDLETILETSEVAVIGIDGGGLDDLLGFCIIGRHRKTKAWQAWARAWADRDILTLRKKIAPQLLDLEKAGELVLVDNLEEEANPEIVALCEQVRDAGIMPAESGIGMDPEGVAAIIDDLIAAGFAIEDMRSITQGYKLNAAIKGAPGRLKNKRLVHCDQGLMKFCVENARTEARGNAVIVTKAESGTGKIDPLMALFSAYMLMSWNPVADRPDLSDFLENAVMVA
jgi:phage terminase large subunit-like protein